MKEGTIVRIKANAIKDGLLKERMRAYMFRKGVVNKSGPANCDDEVSVCFNDMYANGWLMPKDSLEIIEEPDMKIQLELKKSSWKNIFDSIRDSVINAQGNFWASIQSLEEQYNKAKEE